MSMSAAENGIAFRELLAYSDYLADRWLTYFGANPGAFDIAVGGKTGTVRDLVFHIVMVEQTFARLLHDGQRPDPPAVIVEKAKQEPRTVENFARLHREAQEKLTRYAATATDGQLRGLQDFGTRQVSSRKVLTQAALHGVHHWSQIALLVRQAGFPTDRPQDIILTNVME